MRSQHKSLLLVHSLAWSLLLIINVILDILKSKHFGYKLSCNAHDLYCFLVKAGCMTIEQVPYSLHHTVFSILKTPAVQALPNLTYHCSHTQVTGVTE